MNEHILDCFKIGLQEKFDLGDDEDRIWKLFLELAKCYNSTLGSQSTEWIKFEFNNPAPAPVEDNVLEYRDLPQLPFEDSVSQDDREMIETLYVTFVQDGFIIFN